MRIKGHSHYFYQEGADRAEYLLVRNFDDNSYTEIARGYGQSPDRDARNLAALQKALESDGLDAEGRAQIEDAIRVNGLRRQRPSTPGE
jgi:hypothetical protein